jgi:hypothetical protein
MTLSMMTDEPIIEGETVYWKGVELPKRVAWMIVSSIILTCHVANDNLPDEYRELRYYIQEHNSWIDSLVRQAEDEQQEVCQKLFENFFLTD